MHECTKVKDQNIKRKSEAVIKQELAKDVYAWKHCVKYY